MSRITFFLIFVVLSFGLPFYFGYFHLDVRSAVLWSIVMAGYTVFGAGWRAPDGSIVKSLLFGACFSVVVCVSVYFIGRWLS